MTAGFVFNYAQAVNRCEFHTLSIVPESEFLAWPLQHAPRKQRLGIRIGMMRILEGLLNIGKQAPALDEQQAREAARTFALREAA